MSNVKSDQNIDSLKSRRKLQSIRIEVEDFLNSNYKEPVDYFKPPVEPQHFEIPTFLRRKRGVIDKREISEQLSNRKATFSERLIELINNSSMSEPEIYKRANIDRKLYSKLKNDAHYQPSKRTAIAFIMALELPYEEAISFLKLAGYSLSGSRKFDVIIKYFILNQEYDLEYINEILFSYNERPL